MRGRINRSLRKRRTRKKMRVKIYWTSWRKQNERKTNKVTPWKFKFLVKIRENVSFRTLFHAAFRGVKKFSSLFDHKAILNFGPISVL